MRQIVRLSCKSLRDALATLTHKGIVVKSPSVSISGNLANVCRTSSFGRGAATFWLDDPEEWTWSSQVLAIAFTWDVLIAHLQPWYSKRTSDGTSDARDRIFPNSISQTNRAPVCNT